MIERGEVKRVGLLATNSIRGGANRAVLESIKQTGDIFWAQSDRYWILDGAAVNVSMIGFSNNTVIIEIYLDRNQLVKSINSDLIVSLQIYLLLKSLHLKKTHWFILYWYAKRRSIRYPQKSWSMKMLSDKGNPNNRSNSDVIKPLDNEMGLDITSQNRHMWIIDFGSYMSHEDASKYEMPFEYVVKQMSIPRKKRFTQGKSP